MVGGMSDCRYKLENGHFITNDGMTKTIHIDTEQHSQSWLEKQNASTEEYKVTHTRDGISTRSKNIYRLFSAYINDAVYSAYDDEAINVLDVGCGTFTELPPYMGATKQSVTYVGLDPENVNPIRDYLFICGMVEDLHKHLHDDVKFNVFLFSTSLDHIEDIEECARSIHEVAGQPSYCIFYLGLHDVEIVAEQWGGGMFKRIYQDMKIGRVIIRLMKSTLISIPFSFKNMYIRNRKLIENSPLDDKHFHYFTLNNIWNYMRVFGDVVDSVIIPGTNAMFVTVKIDTKR